MLASEANVIALEWQNNFINENKHLVDKALASSIAKVREAVQYGRTSTIANLDNCFNSQSHPVLVIELCKHLKQLGYTVKSNEISLEINWDTEVKSKKQNIFRRLLVWFLFQKGIDNERK